MSDAKDWNKGLADHPCAQQEQKTARLGSYHYRGFDGRDHWACRALYLRQVHGTVVARAKETRTSFASRPVVCVIAAPNQ